MYNLTKSVESGSGSYSSYYRISRNRGIKIPIFQDQIEAEAEYYEMAQAVDFVPRFYGIVDIQISGTKEEGLLLEHIDGENLYWVDDDIVDQYTKEDLWREMVEDLYRMTGIVYEDNNLKNIIVTLKEGKEGMDAIESACLIDFSPEWCHVQEEEVEDCYV